MGAARPQVAPGFRRPYFAARSPFVTPRVHVMQRAWLSDPAQGCLLLLSKRTHPPELFTPPLNEGEGTGHKAQAAAQRRKTANVLTATRVGPVSSPPPPQRLSARRTPCRQRPSTHQHGLRPGEWPPSYPDLRPCRHLYQTATAKLARLPPKRPRLDPHSGIKTKRSRLFKRYGSVAL